MTIEKPTPPAVVLSTAQLKPGACICRQWCRSDLGGQTIDGKQYPAPNHADGCPAQIREAFTVLTLDWAHCVMEPHEADAWQAAEPDTYTATTVMLTRDQFERMAEFQGF